MDPITLIFIALGLSMDALAVSVASGIAIRDSRLSRALKMAFFFGAFQAVMPVIGWLAGLSVRGHIEHFDHWVAFGLLAFIGGKMIYEAFKIEEAEKGSDPFSLFVLFGLAVATSIDALAVGLSMALLNVSIVAPVLVIGAVTFALSFAGVIIGEKAGHFFEKKLEIAGGLVLIAIGAKILLEHLVKGV
ncbi:MAG TPA: manganese efflux pump MntP family protein [bacterium]|nr:manganese efflux pump MntP family protein [bacterium]